MSKIHQLNAKLFSIQTERHSLAGLCKFPDIYSDISVFIKMDDYFNDTHKTIFRIICNFIEQKEILNKITLSGKIKQLGITHFEDDLDIDTYIDNIFSTPIKDKETAISNFKNLIDYRIRRNIYFLSQELNELALQNTENTKSLITSADSIYTEKIKSIIQLNTDSGPENICRDIKDVIEDLGDNPPDPSLHPFGPFETINRLYGSLSRKSNITCIAARSGVAKTSFGLFYHVWMAEKYGFPILHCDFGEMSKFELQVRMAACMSQGKVSLYDIEYGSWRNNAESVKIIRSLWPRVEKIKLYYQDVSKMNAKQFISFWRRFHYSVIGRENTFLTNYDYLKPFDDDFDTPEWKQIGHFFQDIKSFITNEDPLSFWTSLQVNRSGITTNKHSSQIDDSENSFSMSDRIIQQSSHGILIRRKTNDELEKEGGEFGNLKAIFAKTRHLGKDYKRALNPVKMPDDSYKSNYVNIESNNFFFQDKGDLNDLSEYLKDKIHIQDHSHADPNDKTEMI